MLRDYGVTFTDEEADGFGISVLKLYKMACIALARAEENQRSNELMETNNQHEEHTS